MATNSSSDIHYSFMRSILSNASIPASHTLVPPKLFEEKTFPATSKLSACLLHNEPVISENLRHFCSGHSIHPLSDTVRISEDELRTSPTNYHYYSICITPSNNYTDILKTAIKVDEETYTFDGFTLVSRQKLNHVVPLCLPRYGYNYSVRLESVNEESPIFKVTDALLIEEYLFNVVLQLHDMTHVLKCLNNKILFIPRFKSQEMKVLSLSSVLQWMINMRRPLPIYLETEDGRKANQISEGWLVTNPKLNPSTIRIDRLQWPQFNKSNKEVPHVVHFSSFFVDGIHSSSDHEVYRPSSREMMLSFPSENFLLTGLYTDITQHALLLPLLIGHILYHNSLLELEEKLDYRFKDRQLLERALTQPSYCHLETVLGKQVNITASNCGPRRPQVNPVSKSTPGRDIKAAIQRAEEVQSEAERLRHNEQLEFLGDAVLEYICSLHLYHMLPDEKLGQLALYRTLLVKNKHLAILAQRLDLKKYILTNVPCRNSEPLPSDSMATATPDPLEAAGPLSMDAVAHTNANTLEAVIGAVFVDAGLSVAQELIARLFFPEEDLHRVWMDYPPDPLQSEHPDGDRHLMPSSPVFQKLVKLEELTGIQFKHIRLLARAFTHSSVPLSRLVGGSYEKLEHLGDAVLQFLASNYIYCNFPSLHEGHYSLLRITLVQNKQLAELCKQLGFDQYIRKEGAVSVGVKILADVVESYLAALLLDKGLEYCQRFLEVCHFPRLLDIVKASEVEDAHTQLQKATARLCRRLHIEQEIPCYRQLGSSNMQPFTIGVYFKNKRLATGVGSSLRDARKKAAEKALESDVLKYS